jgi:GNAT superfamily N-acetyltransferase
MPEPGAAPTATLVEVLDEHAAEVAGALDLIARTFERSERHALDELRSELEEKRRRLVPRNRPHLLAAVADGQVVGAIYGVYLAGPNCGFVAYVAVDPGHRGGGLARRLRAELSRCFRRDAVETGQEELAWIAGEVRRASPWLTRLVRDRGAIPLDFTYYHPGIGPGDDAEPYTLYLEPISETRRELPVLFVRRIAFAIFRVAYRVRYPLLRPNFRAMLEELEGRTLIGPHPEVMSRAEAREPE